MISTKKRKKKKKFVSCLRFHFLLIPASCIQNKTFVHFPLTLNKKHIFSLIATKVMAYLLDKELSAVFEVLLRIAIALIPLSHFAAFAFAYSTTSLVAAAAARDVGKEWKETEALLNWRSSLDNQSQTLLSSWGEGNPCKWVGIRCDEAGSLTGLNLSSFGLIDTLSNLSFSSFPATSLPLICQGILFMEIFLTKLVTFPNSPSQLGSQ